MRLGAMKRIKAVRTRRKAYRICNGRVLACGKVARGSREDCGEFAGGRKGDIRSGSIYKHRSGGGGSMYSVAASSAGRRDEEIHRHDLFLLAISPFDHSLRPGLLPYCR